MCQEPKAMVDFYGQNGEDRVLAKIFPGKSGTCLEVGANDGVHLSNTYHFERSGWRCILVEPNQRLCDKIRKVRTATLFECAASEKAGEAVLHVGTGRDDVYSSLERSVLPEGGHQYKPIVVPTRTLDAMLEEAGVASLEFASIDVEGHETQALRGFTLNRWKPRLVLLEDNSDMASTEIENHMRKAKYFRFWRSGSNDWYALCGTSRLWLLARTLLSGCFSLRGVLKGNLPRRWMRILVLAKRAAFGWI